MIQSTFGDRLGRIEQALRWLLMKDMKDADGKPIVTLRGYNEQAELLDRASAQPSSGDAPPRAEPSESIGLNDEAVKQVTEAMILAMRDEMQRLQVTDQVSTFKAAVRRLTHLIRIGDFQQANGAPRADESRPVIDAKHQALLNAATELLFAKEVDPLVRATILITLTSRHVMQFTDPLGLLKKMTKETKKLVAHIMATCGTVDAPILGNAPAMTIQERHAMWGLDAVEITRASSGDAPPRVEGETSFILDDIHLDDASPEGEPSDG